jgi:hypothetical protein
MESWTFKNSLYELHKTPKSFNAASQAAIDAGGHLAEVDNTEENNAIFQEVSNLVNASEFSSTTSQDGGESAYVWIGGTDQASEGAWKWTNSGNAIALSRSEWGSGALGNEPDGGNFQNGLGLGLENWPKGSSNGSGFGSAGSWNDINTSSTLFYVVEKEIKIPTTEAETGETPTTEETINEYPQKTFTITSPNKFKKKSSKKIKNFNTESDLLQIDTASFGIDDILDPATAEQAKGKKAVKKLAKQDFDFLYDQKKGGLYFNENGSDKGFGDGGIIAILKGAPDLSADNLEFT